MKKVKIATVVFFILLTAVSCKKEKNESPVLQPEVEKKLKEFSNVNNPSDKITYKYDASGKTIVVENSANSWSFTYQPMKLIVTRTNISNGQLLGTMDLTLDAAGKAVSMINKNGLGSITSTSTYQYNMDGYLVTVKDNYPGGDFYETVFTITGGNVSSTKSFTNGVLKDKTDYEYDNSVKNKVNASMQHNWGVKNIFGKESLNEINGFKRYNAAGTLTFQISTVFTLDAGGYLTKRKDSYPLSGALNEYNYSYY